MNQKLETPDLHATSTPTQGFPSYPEYRDSGVRWYGQVPSHWDISLLGRLGTVSGSGIDKKTRGEDVPVRMVNYTDVYGNQAREVHGGDHLMETTAPPTKAEEHSLQKGDVLFTPSSETRDEIGVSAVVMQDLPETVYSYHLTRFRPHIELDDSYKKYFANNKTVLGYFESVAEGTTRMTLTQGDLKRAPVLLPSREEQEAIGAFLDRKTAKIDRLIDKKERLVELLEERRTALITKAVTKGLDPDVPMKDSGVEWLGEIPEHWDSCRFGRVFTVQGGYAFRSTDFATQGIPLVRMSNLKNGLLEFDEPVFIPPDVALERYALQAGDLLVGMSGSIENYAWVTQADVPCQLNQRVGRISAHRSTGNLRFAMYLFNSALFSYQIQLEAAGTAQVNISASQIEGVWIPLPPPHEQQLIAGFLDHKISKIAKLLSAISKGINLLKEYRSALITAAVTGKVDVRDYAA